VGTNITVLDVGSRRGRVLEYIAQDWRLIFSKIFGPVLSVTTFENEGEAVELANSTVYGLGAAVFSSDASQCMRLTSAIDSGTVRRVDHTPGFAADFGG
jgi:acyl-CoA reductase-like NAD-dependent aldehyde dehydrogenase